MTLTIPDFSHARVLVAGDVMLDRYLFGGTSRISPEAPVPVVHVRYSDDRPGGAANVAVNLASLGAEGVSANSPSDMPVISSDGRHVAFRSDATCSRARPGV